jgi:predicted nicotinamide N-methyase
VWRFYLWRLHFQEQNLPGSPSRRMPGHFAACAMLLVLGAAHGVTVAPPMARLRTTTRTLMLTEAAADEDLTNVFGQDSTGRKIWDAGRVLSQLMSDASDSIRGKRVLELGSGTGVGGLTAAASGAVVSLTDGVKSMLPLLEANAKANDLARSVSVQRLRWGNEAEVSSLSGQGPYDLIIGSDLLYAPEAFDDLLDTLSGLCTPGRTEVLLTYPTRFTEPIFFEQADELFEQLDSTEVEPALFATRLMLRA